MGGSREGKDEAPGDRKGVRMRDGSQRGKAEGPRGGIKLEQLSMLLGEGLFEIASERGPPPAPAQ